MLDPPLQDLPRLKSDPSVKLVSTADIGTQYLALDQHRAELPDSGVPGRNPFKDRRVRLAVWQAIDTDLIVRQVLRGQGLSTGSAVSPLVEGHVAALDKRPPYDPAAARALLKEAGYAGGFRVTLDCVSVSVRAAACQAMASMLEKVGIKVNFQPAPAATFFPKVTQAISSFMEFGWAPGPDAWFVLNTLLRTNDGMCSGAFNGGRYSNPKLRRADRRRARRARPGASPGPGGRGAPADPRRRRHHPAVPPPAHLGDAPGRGPGAVVERRRRAALGDDQVSAALVGACSSRRAACAPKA